VVYWCGVHWMVGLGWALVVDCCLSVLVCLFLSISTHVPPCEQWLTVVGVGTGLLFRVWHSFVVVCWHSGLSFVGVGAGWV
jgi:hypothetical protein